MRFYRPLQRIVKVLFGFIYSILNFLKTNGDDVFAEFHAKNIITKKFDLLDNVFTFDRSQEFAIKGSRAFYDGKIYLQSIASMLPTLVLNPQK